MAAQQSTVLAKNAANLAAQLALVESRGREKSDSRPSTGTVVSIIGDSVKHSRSTSRAPSQTTTGHTSPKKLEDSVHTSWVPSQATTGHTSPTRLDDSSPTSLASSWIPTGCIWPAKLEDPDEAHSETTSKEHDNDPHLVGEEDGKKLPLTIGSAEEEDLQRPSSRQAEILHCSSVAKAVEAFEAKITSSKKVPK